MEGGARGDDGTSLAVPEVFWGEVGTAHRFLPPNQDNTLVDVHARTLGTRIGGRQ